LNQPLSLSQVSSCETIFYIKHRIISADRINGRDDAPQQLAMEPLKMKPYDPDFVGDVEELLEKAIVEEVGEAVWRTFEKAFSQLDEENRNLLEKHLSGTPNKQLSMETGLGEEELKKCLVQIKRQLQQSIRKDLRVRQ